MHIPTTKPLFPWDCLDDTPSLKTIKMFLDCLPESEVLESLRRARGRGRNDYPVRVLWRVAVLRVLLRHRWTSSFLEELHRNQGLWPLACIEDESQIPNKPNMSRFEAVLGSQPHLGLVRKAFDSMIRRLSGEVADLGKNCAGDATGLLARRDGDATNADGLPQPDGGRKEYTDEEGKVTKIVEWFGYKIHLIVDVKHEVIVAWQVTAASTHDVKAIPALLEQAIENLPNPKATEENGLPKHRIQTLAYDMAADDGDTHKLLDDNDIKPIIPIRSMWEDEHERMLPHHDGTSNIVYDEAGTVYCYDKVSDPPVRRRMAYIGQEPSRRTIKYRCPAMHEGFSCPSHDRCNCGKKYGKTVRIDRDTDLRRFPSCPRITMLFERLYKGRTAVERANARLKIYWGADDGNVTGAARFHAHVSILMLVHAGLATLLASAPRHEGATKHTMGTTHISHIAKRLQAKIKQQNAA